MIERGWGRLIVMSSGAARGLADQAVPTVVAHSGDRLPRLPDQSRAAKNFSSTALICGIWVVGTSHTIFRSTLA